MAETFYEKWAAILKKAPTLPEADQKTLLPIVQELHGRYQQRLAEDRMGVCDQELLHDLSIKVDAVYRKFVLGEANVAVEI